MTKLQHAAMAVRSPLTAFVRLAGKAAQRWPVLRPLNAAGLSHFFFRQTWWPQPVRITPERASKFASGVANKGT
jgi:hypothetical protein